MSILSVLRQEQNGVVFADPAKPDYTVRFRNTNANKALNGVNVKNYVTEIIVNDDNPVTLGTVSAKDAVSVRIRTSGTAESATRLAAILTAIAAQLTAWEAQHVFQGFNPTTYPLVP